MTAAALVRPSPRNVAAILDALAAPFAAEHVGWMLRDGKLDNNVPKSVAVPFIDICAVMDRLDQVLGPENWKDDYRPVPNSTTGLLCELSIRIWREDEGYTWLTKVDGADPTAIERTKGGISSAMKRAAVRFGIGRYLHRLPKMYASFVLDRRRQGPGRYFGYVKASKDDKRGVGFAWNPPTLPSWALPNGSGWPGPTRTSEGDKKGDTKTDRTRGGQSNAAAASHTAGAAGVPAGGVSESGSSSEGAPIDPCRIELPKLIGFTDLRGVPLGKIPVADLRRIHRHVEKRKPHLAEKVAHVIAACEQAPGGRIDDLPF
jgi:hypothetical protein